MAPAIAFNALFAAIPLLLVAASVAAFVYGTDAGLERAYDAVALYAPQLHDLVANNLDAIVRYRGISGAIGLSGALAWFGAFAWFKKGLGWGDVKLAGATGAALGWPLTMTAVACISLVGALQAVVSVMWRDTAEKKREGLPYAVAIALGAAWAIWWEH